MGKEGGRGRQRVGPSGLERTGITLTGEKFKSLARVLTLILSKTSTNDFRKKIKGRTASIPEMPAQRKGKYGSKHKEPALKRMTTGEKANLRGKTMEHYNQWLAQRKKAGKVLANKGRTNIGSGDPLGAAGRREQTRMEHCRKRQGTWGRRWAIGD